MNAASDQVDYTGRDGAAEAHRDLAAGKGLKLYYRAFDGLVPSFQFPGLRGKLSSAPPRATTYAEDILVRLAEADFREGRRLTEEQEKRRAAAFLFAKTYNQTMFRAKAEEIHRLYPQATIRD